MFPSIDYQTEGPYRFFSGTCSKCNRLCRRANSWLSPCHNEVMRFKVISYHLVDAARKCVLVTYDMEAIRLTVWVDWNIVKTFYGDLWHEFVRKPVFAEDFASRHQLEGYDDLICLYKRKAVPVHCSKWKVWKF